MHDGIVHVRSLIGTVDEAVLRLGVASRRWGDSSDAARPVWDDAAGRGVFRRFLDPECTALDAVAPLLVAATEAQRVAIEHAATAAEAAISAAADAARALSAAHRAHQQASAARSEAAGARSEAGRARALGQDVVSRINALGG